MKKYIIILLISVIMPCAVFAEKEHGNEDKVKKEEIFQAKVKTMTEMLKLTPEQVEKFTPIYKEYLHDALSMRPKHIGEASALTRQGKIKPGKELSQAEAYQIASERIAIQRHILEAQQKALKKMQNILTPQQLLDFPHVESQMGRRASEAWKVRHDKRKQELSDRHDKWKQENEKRKAKINERRKSK